MQQMPVDDAGRRNMRDFLQMYNKFTEECFTRCVHNLNYRMLTPEEQACTDKCATKLVNINHRLISVYMEINPIQKKMAEMEAQAQALEQQQQMQQQQQVEGSTTQADTPQNLAAQVKGVFGEETQITDSSRTDVDGSKTDASISTSVDSSQKISATDSLTASQATGKS